MFNRSLVFRYHLFSLDLRGKRNGVGIHHKRSVLAGDEGQLFSRFFCCVRIVIENVMDGWGRLNFLCGKALK